MHRNLFAGLVAGVALLVGVVGCNRYEEAHADLVCLRDGSCVEAGSTSTAVAGTPGPRPSVVPTAISTITVTREPAR